MEELEQLVSNLTAPKNKVGCGAMKELETISQASSQVYSYFDRFLALLAHPNSYVRNRALVLTAQNARWDREGKLDRALDRYLVHILDEKPITARQCVQNLSHILTAKPHLSPKVRAALEGADFTRYPDSMAPLLQRDAIKILKQIDAISETDRNEQ